MDLLAGQVCIVSGAGQGLGRSVALEMASEGGSVMLLERNPDTLRAVGAEIKAAGGIARLFELDVTHYESYRAAVGDIIKEFGRIDVLVNNAAINPPAATILQDTLEDWRRTIGMFTDDPGMLEVFEEAMKIREADRERARRGSGKKPRARA